MLTAIVNKNGHIAHPYLIGVLSWSALNIFSRGSKFYFNINQRQIVFLSGCDNAFLFFKYLFYLRERQLQLVWLSKCVKSIGVFRQHFFSILASVWFYNFHLSDLLFYWVILFQVDFLWQILSYPPSLY